jgi:lipopolysaccharide/colanic/teichoic acid biosynthesis glycosyltransferase
LIRPNSAERALRFAILVAGDFLVAWGCLGLAVFIRRNINFEFTRSLLPPENFPLNPLNVTIFSSALVIALALSGFYDQRVSKRHRPVMGAALLIQLGLVAIASILMDRPYPRTILFAVPILEMVAQPLWRRLSGRLFPIRARDTVLFGSSDDLTAFIDNVDAWIDERIRIIGLVGSARPKVESVPYWGNLDDPCVRTRVKEADELIYVSHDEAPALRLELFDVRGARGYLLLPSQADALLTSATFGWVGDQPLVEIAARCGYGVGAASKRAIDLILATLLLIASLPLWIAIAVAVWIEDRRPILIRQQRVGRFGEIFWMWKFRTMHETEEPSASFRLANDEDERVTGIGLWLRRHRLDELPQLLNVLTGEMSLVGPRPEQPEIVRDILGLVPHFGLRCMIRPGIAGLAQVWAEYDTKPAIKLRYDLTYMCAWSLWLDFRILLRAVSTALAGRGL